MINTHNMISPLVKADYRENASPAPLIVALAAGEGVAVFDRIAGTETYVHEMGHKIAIGLLYEHNPKFPATSVQSDAVDNFNAIPSEGWTGVYRWLTGYDRNQDGAAGVTHRYDTKLTEWGHNLGENGSAAVVSVAGSLPGLLLNTLAISGAIKLSHKNPAAAAALFGYGIANHMISSLYPISAASMSSAEIEQKAAHGHDFANVALQMHKMTGISSETIAITNAVTWWALIPALILGWNINKRCSESNLITDYAALRAWLIKAQSDPAAKHQLNQLYDAYPRKAHMDSDNEFNRFAFYLLKKLPLEEIKKEMVDRITDTPHTKPVEKVVACATIVGSLGYFAERVAYVVSTYLFPASAAFTAVLHQTLPGFAVLSLASAVYTTVCDLKSASLPQQIKMISVAKLICNIVATAAFITLLTVPGANVALLGVYILGMTTVLALSYYNRHLKERHIKIHQAIENENFNFMAEWTKEYIVAPSKDHGALREWFKNIKRAEKLHLLTPGQQEKLNELRQIAKAFKH